MRRTSSSFGSLRLLSCSSWCDDALDVAVVSTGVGGATVAFVSTGGVESRATGVAVEEEEDGAGTDMSWI